ncbi:MAG: DUF6049 family protein, partial [Lapillicoccus sp.]
MTHPGRRRARHLLLLVLILLVGGFAGPATTGYAAAPPSVATDGARGRPPLTLEAVTPPVAGPGVAVTLSGTVQAPGNAGLTAPTVRLVLGATPVLTRAAVSAWATSTSALTGSEVASVKLTAPVAAGASAPFTLTVPAGRLTLTRSFGVIPVAIQLRDTASGTNEVVHTFVGWQRTKQYESLRLGIVAPVTLPPDANLFATDATTRTSAWTSALAPGGRVDRVLDGTDVSGPAGPVPVTWAVDPALVAPAQGSGDPVAPLVAPLLTRLATGVGRHTLWALPSADPDLAATVVSAPNDP